MGTVREQVNTFYGDIDEIPARHRTDLWVICRRPSDIDAEYTVRRQIVWKGEIYFDRKVQTADDLEQARAMVPRGLRNFGRAWGDDPVIVEVWI